MNAPSSQPPAHEKKLRELIELAEDNQLAVQDAIACLSAEREAFVRERTALVKSTVNSAEVSDTLRRATAQAIPALEAAADKAIQSAVGKLMGLTADAAAPQWSEATNAVFERLGSAVQLAGAVEDRVKAAGRRLTWQGTALWAVGCAATVAVAATGVQQIRFQQVELQRQQAELQAQRTAFSEDLARMQASVTFLEKKGGRIRMSKCGPEQRLCIEVAPDQGHGRSNFRGVWSDDANERSYVIPRGY
jgi:hypothetical protein